MAADHRIDSEGPCSCIVQHQRWWRGDVGEQIGIDCDVVSSLVALDAQGAGPLSRADEDTMRTRQAEAGVAVHRKWSTHDSSASGAGLHDQDRKRWEERRSFRVGNGRNQMGWDGLNGLGDDREERDERMVRVGMGKAKKYFEIERMMWKYSTRRCLNGPLMDLQRIRLCLREERTIRERKKRRGKGKKELTETGACLCREKAMEGARVGRRHGN